MRANEAKEIVYGATEPDYPATVTLPRAEYEALVRDAARWKFIAQHGIRVDLGFMTIPLEVPEGLVDESIKAAGAAQEEA